MNYNKSVCKPEQAHIPRHSIDRQREKNYHKKHDRFRPGRSRDQRKKNNNRTKVFEPQIPGPQHQNAQKLNFLEGAVRNLMKTYIQRGKVDVYITYEDYTLDNGALKYNRELASEYITCLKQMQQDFDLDYDIKVSTLSRYPEVLVMEEQSVDEEALWESLEPPLREACEKFVQTRILEGRNLEKDLIGKLDSLEEKVLRVEARSPEVVNAYRTKLEAKVSELLEDTQIDDNRIAAEVILFSDKICNDEETVRLHSHIRNMKKMLTTEKEGIGRKLDFMAQEMNREANTILSKSSDLEISNIAIDLKTEIEKVREQIQNVE